MRTYEPRGAARELLLNRDPEVLISGPAGTGKSLAALFKLHATLAQVPDTQALLLRQTHASLTASTLVTFERHVAAEALATGKLKWFGGSGRQAPGYLYPNGSKMSVGGLDKPGKVLSTEYTRITVDEADQISVTAYETLLTRLRGKSGTYKQIVLACNPSAPNHWVKERADAGSTTHLYSRHRDNPYLINRDGSFTPDGSDYMARLDALTGIRRLRYRDGIWAAAEGLVWGGWDDAVNLTDWFEVPPSWPLYLSVDFGFSNPFVCQWWRQDPDGRMYLTREIHKTQTLVEDHARHIKAIMEENPDEPRPSAVICDHDAEDRATLTKHLGLPTIAARKSVSPGIQEVETRLRPAADGRARLLVFKDCVVGRDDVAAAQKRPRGYAAEVTGYVWETHRGSDGIPKEAPVKVNDHSCDATRYAAMHLAHSVGRVGNPARGSAAAPGQGNAILSRPVGR